MSIARQQLPPIVLIHGLWSQPPAWSRWQAALESAGYRCLAIRLPGHMPAPNQDTLETLGRLTLRDYVDTAKAVVESLVEPPIVIGHSLGGLIAQILVSETDLAAAVLVNPAAPAAVCPLRPGNAAALARHLLWPGFWHTPFRLSPQEARQLLFNRIPEADQDELIDDLVFESGRVVVQASFGFLSPRPAAAVDKHAIDCPLLAIVGQQDRIVPVSVSRRIAKWYGHRMTYWEYPGHAHWPLQEPGWEQLVEQMLQWLNRTIRNRQLPLHPD